MTRPAHPLRTLGQRWLVAVLWLGLCLSGAAHVGLHGHAHHGAGGHAPGARGHADAGHVHGEGALGSDAHATCAPVAARRLAAEPAPTPEPEPTSRPVEESGECALCALALVLPPNAPRAPTGVRPLEPSRALPAPVAPATTPREARVPRGPPRVG